MKRDPVTQTEFLEEVMQVSFFPRLIQAATTEAAAPRREAEFHILDDPGSSVRDADEGGFAQCVSALTCDVCCCY